MYVGTKGEPLSFEEARERADKARVASQSSPAVIDRIGIAETIALARERFLGTDREYLSIWAKETEGNSEEFSQWLEQIRQTVRREVGDVWRTSKWHAAWFERACEGELDDALGELVASESRRARSFEMQHLKSPHLSLAAIVATDGKPDLALVFDSTEQVLKLGREALERAQAVRMPEADITEPSSSNARNHLKTKPDRIEDNLTEIQKRQTAL
jgi:hypothetical protein